jgi:replicative DNA helicase
MPILERVPPYSQEAEAALLGAMMLSKEAVCKAFEALQEDEFYKEAHKKIFKACLKLFENNQPIDLITVSDQLKKENTLEEVGGYTYLNSLVDILPSSENINYYLKIIQDKAILRRLIEVGTQIVDSGYNQQQDASEILDQAEQLLFNLVSKKPTQDFVSVGSLLHESFITIEELHKRAKERKAYVTGVPSGFIDLDLKTAGFHPGDLIIIASRPSMGKSSFCLNILAHVGIVEKIPCGIFSLEMSKEQVVFRLLCSEARVNGQRIRTGKIEEEDWPKLTAAAGRLQEAPIFVDDTPAIPILELRAKSRRLKAKYNIGLLIVDYLQLVQGRPAETREQQISEISRSLKALAKELNLPVIAVSQLSRAVETRQDPKPRLSDLRESGAIEQDADLVLFIYREEYYKPSKETEGIAEIIIGKQRHGPVGSVKLAFLKDYAKFELLKKYE